MKQRDGHINQRSQDKLRASIKCLEIIEAVQDHVLGKLKMTNTQIRGAEILLRKVQPDLTATALSEDSLGKLPLLKIIRRSEPNDAA